MLFLSSSETVTFPVKDVMQSRVKAENKTAEDAIHHLSNTIKLVTIIKPNGPFKQVWSDSIKVKHIELINV